MNSYLYSGYTLIDITETKITRFTPKKEFERNQQRNWETLLQVIGLRTQVIDPTQSMVEDDVSEYKFGSSYSGRHTIWHFEFGVELKDQFLTVTTKNHNEIENPIGTLLLDLNNVPIIPSLKATAEFTIPVFTMDGVNKNTYVTAIK
jgi:hypothetical protein|tara:strand:- start:486 stop:926 length:441 start_codon:yes stop_codon:yes gene_type:complete